MKVELLFHWINVAGTNGCAVGPMLASARPLPFSAFQNSPVARKVLLLSDQYR